MKSASKIKAKDFVNENPPKAYRNESLTQIKNKLDEHSIRSIPVVESKDSDEFVGAVGYRDLIRFIQFNPESTKLEKVMHTPAEFEYEETLVDLCSLRINSGNKMMVALEDKELKGILGDREFLNAFRETQELSNKRPEDLMETDLLVVRQTDSVDKARHKMLDENISRLPVTNSSGKLVGFLNSTTILDTMIKRSRMNSGGTSGNRTGDEIIISGGGEKTRMSEITVNEIMDRTPPMYQEETEDTTDLVERMIEADTTEMVKTEDQYPKSLITVKDIIDFIYDLRATDTVLVNINGAESQSQRQKIHKVLKRQIQGSLGRKLDKPEEIKVSVKTQNRDGNQRHYEVKIRLFSELGITEISQDGWDLQNILDDGLEQLNRRVRDSKTKQRDY